MLTIAEIAKRYGLPESTARFYCKRFLSFLPHAGHGKRRRFLPEAALVIEAILEEMKDSKNAHAVEAILAGKFPKVPFANDPAHQAPTKDTAQDLSRLEPLMANQVDALRQVAGVLGRMVAFQDKIENMFQRLNSFETKLDQLNNAVSQIKRLQDDAERIHQQDIEILRKWLGHLAKERKP